MPKEKLEFRPNVPQDIQAEQLEILEHARKRIKDREAQGEIDHDAESFKITVELKTGKKITESIPKNTGDIVLGIKTGDDPASIEEAVEAVQKFYPEMEKPNLLEAVRMLRGSRSRPKPKK